MQHKRNCKIFSFSLLMWWFESILWDWNKGGVSRKMMVGLGDHKVVARCRKSGKVVEGRERVWKGSGQLWSPGNTTVFISPFTGNTVPPLPNELWAHHVWGGVYWVHYTVVHYTILRLHINMLDSNEVIVENKITPGRACGRKATLTKPDSLVFMISMCIY